MNQYILLFILFTHWLSDFVFQTHTEATKKSTSLYWLLKHTTKYSIFMTIFFSMIIIVTTTFGTNYQHFFNIFLFWSITFQAHTITDFFTSKLTKKYFSSGNYHNGFVVVGFDQILHYIQLYLTFKLLI